MEQREVLTVHALSVLSCSRLACSKILPTIKEKKVERSQGNGRTQYKLADGVTALAQLRVSHSDKTRSFNQ